MIFPRFAPGELILSGYPGSLVRLVEEKEFLDESKYHLFASQFDLRSDASGSWRGEYWGKFVRGACTCYRYLPSQKLYRCIENSVLEMVEIAKKNGTLSTYPPEKDLFGWDVWSRKYALLGMLSYYQISKSEAKKRKVLREVERQATLLTKQIGPKKSQKGILETSSIYGSLNSASILGLYCNLFSLTKKQRYLDFASYIVSTGLSYKENLFEKLEKTDEDPYQWETRKAYEMIACFQGVLRYGLITSDPHWIELTKEFVRRVERSEFTLIGGLGLDSEFFSHSKALQAQPTHQSGLETCVTVSFMSLLMDLLSLTGDASYAQMLETICFNALPGSVNDQNQTMELAEGRIWHGDTYDTPPHESYLFDSYTPLVNGRRATLIGGYQRMQDDRSYGCCAANGGYGLGLMGQFACMKREKGFDVNFYSPFSLKTTHNDKPIALQMKANLFQSGKVTLRVIGNGTSFALRLLAPTWGKARISINGEEVLPLEENGYFVLNRVWNDDQIKILFSRPVKIHACEDKIAFTKGPIVLAADSRLGDVTAPFTESTAAKTVKNVVFPNQLTVEFPDGKKLVDFADSGKNMDDPTERISVWLTKNSLRRITK